MNPTIKRKLNEHIEFVVAKQPGRLDPLEIRAQVLAMLDYPEQTAILGDAVLRAITAWINRRVDRSRPEQMAIPDCPNIPPLIRVGRQHVVAFEQATAGEVEIYYQKRKSKVEAQEAQLSERLQESLDDVRRRLVESLAQAKAELAEVARIRKMVRQADRTSPGITVAQVLQREADRKKKTEARRP